MAVGECAEDVLVFRIFKCTSFFLNSLSCMSLFSGVPDVNDYNNLFASLKFASDVTGAASKNR